MKVKKYMLLSGKIHRVVNGESQVFRGPCEFVPTEAEIQGNKNRLRFIGEFDVPDATATGVATATAMAPSERPAIQTAIGTTPIDLAVPLSIADMDLKSAKEAVAGVTDPAKLDILLLQEADKKPLPRKGVIAAIEARRAELSAAAADQPAQAEVIEPFKVDHLI